MYCIVLYICLSQNCTEWLLVYCDLEPSSQCLVWSRFTLDKGDRLYLLGYVIIFIVMKSVSHNNEINLK